MNRATLIGNLTKDPDMRQTQSGVSVCTFTLAVQRRYADQNGEKQTDFFNVVCWRGLADNCAKQGCTAASRTAATRTSRGTSAR